MSLCAIAKILDDMGKNEAVVFFNTETKEVETMTLKEIKNTTKKLVGVGYTNAGFKLYAYFTNIGIVGENGVRGWTVVQKQLSETSTDYLLVSTIGRQRICNRAEISKMIDDGENISGCIKESNGNLKFASNLDIVVKEEHDE